MAKSQYELDIIFLDLEKGEKSCSEIIEKMMAVENFY